MRAYWRRLTCGGCGCEYRCLYGSIDEDGFVAWTPAPAQVSHRHWTALFPAVDCWPCPECGVVAPALAGKLLAGSHAALALRSGIALVIGALVGLWTASLTWLPWAGAAAGLVLTGRHALLLRAGRALNADLAAHRARALAAVASGTVLVETPAALDSPRRVPGALSAVQVAALGLLAAGSVSIASSAAARAVEGSPFNVEWFPPVVGPGDTTRLSFPEPSLTTWRGTASVQVLNAAELGLADPRLAGTSSDARWGSTITVNRRGGSGSPPWIDVTIPPLPELAGRTLDLRLALTVVYPEAVSDRTFDNKTITLTREARLQLGSAHAGSRYWLLLLGGGLGGGFAVVLAGYWLKRVGHAIQTKEMTIGS